MQSLKAWPALDRWGAAAGEVREGDDGDTGPKPERNVLPVLIRGNIPKHELPRCTGDGKLSVVEGERGVGSLLERRVVDGFEMEVSNERCCGGGHIRGHISIEEARDDDAIEDPRDGRARLAPSRLIGLGDGVQRGGARMDVRGFRGLSCLLPLFVQYPWDPAPVDQDLVPRGIRSGRLGPESPPPGRWWGARVRDEERRQH